MGWVSIIIYFGSYTWFREQTTETLWSGTSCSSLARVWQLLMLKSLRFYKDNRNTIRTTLGSISKPPNTFIYCMIKLMNSLSSAIGLLCFFGPSLKTQKNTLQNPVQLKLFIRHSMFCMCTRYSPLGTYSTLTLQHAAGLRQAFYYNCSLESRR